MHTHLCVWSQLVSIADRVLGVPPYQNPAILFSRRSPATHSQAAQQGVKILAASVKLQLSHKEDGKHILQWRFARQLPVRLV